MFSYPAFLLSYGTASWQEPIRVVAWICGIIGLALAWAAAVGYVGPARDALRTRPHGAGASGRDEAQPSADRSAV